MNDQFKFEDDIYYEYINTKNTFDRLILQKNQKKIEYTQLENELNIIVNEIKKSNDIDKFIAKYAFKKSQQLHNLKQDALLNKIIIFYRDKLEKLDKIINDEILALIYQ